MEGEFSKFRTDVILADRSTGRMFSDKIRQVYLELPYFPRGSWEECENDFERWIYLLKHMETLERMPERLRKSVFERLLEVADVASLTKEERVDGENYFRQLGKGDSHTQTAYFSAQKARLSACKEQCEREAKARTELYTKLGLLAGLALVVLIM